MCGICGIIKLDNQNIPETDIRTMMQAMKHRGPDDEGLLIDNNVALGFVRLSILDLSPAGNQPFISPDGRYVIVYNGEVYNYLELRHILQQKGYDFKSRADTEVVLNGYIEWGESCLDRFNGMWAFAIYDKVKRIIFAARDRFGIKPFYYYKNQETFIFASEITALLKVLPISISPNNNIIYDFLLTNRTNYSEQTFFNKINKLQHGHKISINVNEKQIVENCWYTLGSKQNQGFINSGEFKDALMDSIKLQLRSDVPIGLCLSGGLDSSSIGASITKVFKRNDIHSFSAIYGKGIKGDESGFIQEFNGYIDNIHFTYPTGESFYDDLDLFIATLSEPVPNTSEYAEFKVMKLANQYCTVVLNGQGVDEYMAGYDYMIGFYLKQCFFQMKWPRLINEIYHYHKEHHSWEPIKEAMFYTLPTWLKKEFLFKKVDYINNEFAATQSKSINASILEKLYNSNSMHQAFIDHFQYKFEHHLIWADKTGMKFSLETRFPFLDHRIIEKMIYTDNDLIYKNGITKIILRQAMAGILPEKIRMRMDKVGYETPEDTWFRNIQFQRLFFEIINSDRFKQRQYFNNNKVLEIYRKHLSGESHGKELWKIIHLELWLRKYFEN